MKRQGWTQIIGHFLRLWAGLGIVGVAFTDRNNPHPTWNDYTAFLFLFGLYLLGAAIASWPKVER